MWADAILSDRPPKTAAEKKKDLKKEKDWHPRYLQMLFVLISLLVARLQTHQPNVSIVIYGNFTSLSLFLLHIHVLYA